MNTMPPIGAKVVLVPTPQHVKPLEEFVMGKDYFDDGRNGKMVTAIVRDVFEDSPARVYLTISGGPKRWNDYWWPVECMELEGFGGALEQHFI